MDSQISPSDIRNYYDQNTRLFLRFGSSPETQTIHRAVWANGIQTLDAALSYSNQLLYEQVQQISTKNTALRIADLGCGVGASLVYLLTRLPASAQGYGLTISPIQARLARSCVPASVQDSCQIIEADFHRLPLAAGFDLVYSIEAYVHASEPAAYLREAARLLSPGGLLVLCDDFLADSADHAPPDPHAQEWLAAYQKGWYVPNLRPVSETTARAASLGMSLVSDRELTRHLRLRALPDMLARAVLALGRVFPGNHPIVPSMLGSMALQQCLQNRLIEYHFLVYRKLEA